ncbi:unnamed protein product [Gadus morhua 'NCC']
MPRPSLNPGAELISAAHYPGEEVEEALEGMGDADGLDHSDGGARLDGVPGVRDQRQQFPIQTAIMMSLFGLSCQTSQANVRVGGERRALSWSWHSPLGFHPSNTPEARG